MAKNAKKPLKKPAPKTPAKAPAKKAAPPKKAAAKPVAKKPASKPEVKAKAKVEVKAKPVDLPKKKQEPVKPAPAQKAAKKSDTKKKGKKAKEGFDMESEDLLTSDEEIGSEEIPDLSEFVEEEVEETILIETDLDDEESVEAKPASDEVLLTDAEGRVYCRVRDCDQISAVEGYCRYHYLLLWKKIQVRRKILVDGKLERYVEELTARYPDKFLEMIRKDLRTEKDFLNAIAELEIDEAANEAEFEDEAQSYVDEMRGITPEAGLSDDEEF